MTKLIEEMTFRKEATELIRRQGAEIERLTKDRDLALANAGAVYAKLMPEVERLRAALEKAKPHVWASSRAEGMLDGFGPRRIRPSDTLLAEIDEILGHQQYGRKE